MFKKIAAAAILATLASSSFAATPGFYAGVDIGSTEIRDTDLGRETSYGAFLGYTISRNFALEAGLRRLGTWDVSVASADADQASLSLLGSVPLNNQASVYARIGYNRLRAKASVSGFSASESVNKAMYGIGMSYDFGSNIAGRVEVQKPERDTTNVSIGMSYSF
jgi:OOP family OmpA-OmpF porin